jgi:antitoxin (DNA-binding transcriptional repressor) of toxin-antitoxin stability system
MKAASSELEIVTKHGKPVSVIVPIEQYEEMLERMEDASDLAWLKERRKQPLQFRPLGDYLAETNKK